MELAFFCESFVDPRQRVRPDQEMRVGGGLLGEEAATCQFKVNGRTLIPKTSKSMVYVLYVSLEWSEIECSIRIKNSTYLNKSDSCF